MEFQDELKQAMNLELSQLNSLFYSSAAVRKLQDRKDAGKTTNVRAITNVDKYLNYCIAAREINDLPLKQELYKKADDDVKEKVRELLDVTPYELQIQFRTRKTINPAWSDYDKTVAQTHLDNYRIIFLDEYNQPIDDIYETDELYRYYR